MSYERRMAPHEFESAAFNMHPMIRCFALFYAYLEQSISVVRTLEEGVEVCIQVIGLADRFVPIEDKPDAAAQDIERLKQFKQYGMPVANAHALVGIWGAFEAWCKDLVRARANLGFLEVVPEGLPRFVERVGVEIPLASVLAGPRVSVANAVVTALEASASGSTGLGCIEARLAPLDLSVPVEKETRDAVYYAEKIRHLYAHRAGIADLKFVQECPSLGVSVGERVYVDDASMRRYIEAFRSYAKSVEELVVEVLTELEEKGVNVNSRSLADGTAEC